MNPMKRSKIEIARSSKVCKANELIQQSRFSLSTQQQKILLYIISKIGPDDTEFKEYEFSIQTFCKVCGIDFSSGKNYHDLKEAVQGLRDKSMWIRTSEKSQTLVSWLQKARIDEQSGTIQIRLDEDMKPYLLQLKRNYTQYELFYTLNFRSKYSIRLYELVKSVHYDERDCHIHVFKLEELQRLIDAENYQLYGDFKRRALNPAVAEINQFSDKTVSYREIKEGKKVDQIELIITTKDAFEAAKIESDFEHRIDPGQITLWDMLKESGLVSGKKQQQGQTDPPIST